jgi:hypothetical protein
MHRRHCAKRVIIVATVESSDGKALLGIIEDVELASCVKDVLTTTAVESSVEIGEWLQALGVSLWVNELGKAEGRPRPTDSGRWVL